MINMFYNITLKHIFTIKTKKNNSQFNESCFYWDLFYNKKIINNLYINRQIGIVLKILHHFQRTYVNLLLGILG